MRTKSNRRLGRAACLVAAASVVTLEVGPVHARDVLDANDPAFAGAVVVTLPGTTVPAGATSFQFTSNGVTFRRPSLSNRLPRRSADAHAASFCDRLLRD